MKRPKQKAEKAILSIPETKADPVQAGYIQNYDGSPVSKQIVRFEGDDFGMITDTIRCCGCGLVHTLVHTFKQEKDGVWMTRRAIAVPGSWPRYVVDSEGVKVRSV